MRFPFSPRRSVALAALLATGGPALSGTTVVEQPGSGTNRIEVTGNRADGDARTRCGERRADGSGSGKGANANTTTTTNVNSVNIRGQSLSGKTIIVTDGGGDGCPTTGNGGANVNSVNIR